MRGMMLVSAAAMAMVAGGAWGQSVVVVSDGGEPRREVRSPNNLGIGVQPPSWKRIRWEQPVRPIRPCPPVYGRPPVIIVPCPPRPCPPRPCPTPWDGWSGGPIVIRESGLRVNGSYEDERWDVRFTLGETRVVRERVGRTQGLTGISTGEFVGGGLTGFGSGGSGVWSSGREEFECVGGVCRPKGSRPRPGQWVNTSDRSVTPPEEGVPWSAMVDREQPGASRETSEGEARATAGITERATASIRAGRLSEAIGMLREHVGMEPTDARAWRTLGVALLEDRQTKEAASAFARAYGASGVLVDEPMDPRAFGHDARSWRTLVTRSVHAGHGTKSAEMWQMTAALMQAEGREDVARGVIDRAALAGMEPGLVEVWRQGLGG